MTHFYKNIAIALLACTFGVGLTASAADIGRIDETTALVKKAVAFHNANGKVKLLAAVGDKNGAFMDRDLYLSVLDLDTGTTIGHGVNPKLIGKVVLEMKDKNDKYFIKEIFEKARNKGHGQVDYTWPNSVTGQLTVKTVYLEKVENMVIFSGATKK